MILDLFERERAAGRPLVAAFVVATQGSTYRKPGAWMLFTQSGERAGLLSGGCLEGDLGERAARLLAGEARLALTSYDSRSSDDPVWGLGLGCEGLMRIALLRVDAASGYAPLAQLAALERAGAAGSWSVALDVTGGSAPAAPSVGDVWDDDRGQPPGLSRRQLEPALGSWSSTSASSVASAGVAASSASASSSAAAAAGAATTAPGTPKSAAVDGLG